MKEYTSIHQPSITLASVKQYLSDNYKDGCICPACNQNVKLYKRKLTASMAYCLCVFVKYCNENGRDQYHDFNDILNSMKLTPAQRADWQKLTYFKLIKSLTTKRGDKKSGKYIVTETGYKFVMNGGIVPKYCNIYNGKIKGYSMEQTTIKQAFGDKFNFDEIF